MVNFGRVSINFCFSLILAISLLAATNCGTQPANSSTANEQNSSQNQGQSNNTQNRLQSGQNLSVNDNSEELAQYINLPIEPDDLLWKISSDKKNISAVILLSPEAAKKFVSQLEAKQKPSEKKIQLEDWYPEELSAQAEPGDNDSLKVYSYAADDFFKPPFTTGSLMRVKNSDYFLLELKAADAPQQTSNSNQN
jgi:hypothetical protein